MVPLQKFNQEPIPFSLKNQPLSFCYPLEMKHPWYLQNQLDPIFKKSIFTNSIL